MFTSKKLENINYLNKMNIKTKRTFPSLIYINIKVGYININKMYV